MRNNIMYYPAIVVLLASAGSLVFLICAFNKDKKESEKDGNET